MPPRTRLRGESAGSSARAGQLEGDDGQMAQLLARVEALTEEGVTHHLRE